MKIEHIAFRTESIETRAAFESQKGDIDMGEYRIGRSGIYTNGASACIILAAHNAGTRLGLMGHFSSIGEESSSWPDRETFDEALDCIDQLGSKSHTRIWLGGGAPVYTAITPELDEVAIDRRYAVTRTQEKMQELGMNKTALKVEWTPKGKAIDAGIACYAGKLFVRLYTDKDLVR